MVTINFNDPLPLFLSLCGLWCSLAAGWWLKVLDMEIDKRLTEWASRLGRTHATRDFGGH